VGATLHAARDLTIDPISWTQRREDNGRTFLDKYAGLTAEATLARRRLRNHHLITFGLNCPGVARPIGLSSTNSALALSLPWIDGENLTDHVTARCAALGCDVLPAREALDIAYKVARILANLASQGIVHRGVSPEHIVVGSKDGDLWLLNFGASRFIRGRSSSEPETAVDHSEDLRALGRLLYWLATGGALDTPSHGKPSEALVKKARDAAPEIVRGPLARLLNAGEKRGYWHAAAAADDLRRRRDAKDATLLGSRGAPPDLLLIARPPDLVLSTRRFGRKFGVDALLAAYSEIARAPAEDVERKRSILVLVDGHAGVGKTTLAMDACHLMERMGARVEFGKFNQFGDARPMAALVEALNGVIGQILGEDEAIRTAFAERITRALGGLAQVIVDVVPPLMFLIHEQPAPPALSGEASRLRFELLLRRFVGALATQERPLTLFLDDLQWADRPSLDLIRGLLREPSIRHLLVIGAYRTEAVAADHPLLAMIDMVAADGGDLRRVSVTPWTRGDITRFLGDIKIAADSQRSNLAGILFKIAKGNPLGVLIALRCAQDAGCLHFDSTVGLWRASIEMAKAKLAGSTIVELIGRQLARLPEAPREMMAICTLFGASFDLESVATGTNRSPQDVLALLWPALVKGLLIADDDPQPFSLARLRARHDMVQQAAYLSIGAERSREMHGAIGRSMLDAYTADDTLQDRIFEVVQQLNKALREGISDDERWTLIELNVSAGRQARSTGAMNAAFEHYMVTLRLVENDDWTRRPEAMFDLTLKSAEAAYLAAEFVDLDRLLGKLDLLPLRPIDAARVQELRIQSLVARNRLSEALEVGQRALGLLGAGLAPLRDPSEWPAVPSLDELMVGLASDERIDTILRILVWLTPCAYITSFEMYARVILTMMELAIARPFSPLTPISFTNYGLTLCGIGRNKEGFKAGQLALALTEKVDEVSLACKVRTLTYGFLEHWSRPARESLQPMLDTVRDSLLCGDQEYVGYASFLYCDKAWGIEPLAKLEPTMTTHTGAVEHFGHDFSWRHCQVWLQFIQTLLGHSHLPLALVGDVFDMRVDIARLEAANNRFSLFTAQVLIGILCWHRGDRAAALDQCRKADQYALTSVATLLSVDHVMFWCLCELNGYKSLPEEERAEKMKWIDASIERLRHWAESAPDNVGHKLALVEAERARALADEDVARSRYEALVEHAASIDFLHDRALIKERAGDFYSDIGQTQLGQKLFMSAYDEYRAWGSASIADAMMARYGIPIDPARQKTAH
jgi:predicted ATPase/tRNA A-37 threonylcarbamoyl transferase component Bud32